MSIPEELKPTFDFIEEKVYDVHYYWMIYNQIYCSDETIELVNETAPNYFMAMQALIASHTCLSLSKLLDSEKHNNNNNLSLSKLIKELEDIRKDIRDDDFINNLKNLIKEYTTSCENFIKHRNKSIAHFDLPTMQGLSKLPKIKKTEINSSLKLLAEIINSIETEYNPSIKTMYSDPMPGEGDGQTILIMLKESERYRELKKKGGLIPLDDISILEESKKYRKLKEEGLIPPDYILEEHDMLKESDIYRKLKEEGLIPNQA